MPWIALYNEKKKPPRQVPKGEDVICPSCGGTLRVRGPFKDGRVRHFWHTDNLGGGSGGGGGGIDCESVAESDEHAVWKSIAADALEVMFEDRVQSCRMEMQLDAPVSNAKYRQADAIVLFEDRDEQLGQGVVIEVQHKNKSKNKEAVTKDYIEQDLSVVWTTGDDFDTDANRMALLEADLRARARRAVWPDLTPPAWEWSSYEWLLDWQNRSHGLSLPSVSFSEGEELICSATIPNQYFYRRTEWSQLFARYPVTEYIEEIAESATTGPVPFDTSELSGIIPHRYWKKHREKFLGWFKTHRLAVAKGLRDSPVENHIPATIPPAELAELVNRSRRAKNQDLVTLCPHCDSIQGRDHYGEKQLSTTCRICGEWFLFHKHGVTDRKQLETLKQ